MTVKQAVQLLRSDDSTVTVSFGRNTADPVDFQIAVKYRLNDDLGTSEAVYHSASGTWFGIDFGGPNSLLRKIGMIEDRGVTMNKDINANDDMSEDSQNINAQLKRDVSKLATDMAKKDKANEHKAQVNLIAKKLGLNFDQYTDGAKRINVKHSDK